ncbi:alpha/beta fold hydrolase [Niabella terrae]
MQSRKKIVYCKNNVAMPVWVTIILILLAVYLIVSVAIYYLQEFFIFKAEKLPKDFQFYYEQQQVDEYNLPTHDGAVINGLHFKTDQPKGVVLYLKGNSKSIKGWGKFAVDFTRYGYDVLMFDYRGFGKSTGRRTQKGIQQDLQMIYDRLRERVKEKYILLYGRSLGSGFATKLASVNRPRMLILESPYYSLKQVAARFVPFMPLSLALRFPLPTFKWIRYVQCPIFIIHGNQDRLIPYSSAVKLSKINPDKTRLYTVIGGGHKNLNAFPTYHQILSEIIHFNTDGVVQEADRHE